MISVKPGQIVLTGSGHTLVINRGSITADGSTGITHTIPAVGLGTRRKINTAKDFVFENGLFMGARDPE